MRNNYEQRRSTRGYLSRNNAGATSISGDRRSFISGIAAAGLGALACSSARRFTSVLAQAPAVAAKTSLIDVHHRFVPPFYLSENRDRIATSGGGQNPAWLSWTPEQAIAAMDKQGVATAVQRKRDVSGARNHVRLGQGLGSSGGTEPVDRRPRKPPLGDYNP